MPNLSTLVLRFELFSWVHFGAIFKVSYFPGKFFLTLGCICGNYTSTKLDLYGLEVSKLGI